MTYECPSGQLTDEGYKKFEAHKSQIKQELTEENLNKIGKEFELTFTDVIKEIWDNIK